jgi:predicted secreted protein
MPTSTPTVTATPAQSNLTNVQSVAITIAVAGSGALPTGSVVITSGGYTSDASTLVNGATVINVPGGVLAVATDTLTAAYTPDAASSGTYASATGTCSVTVTKVVVQLPTKLKGYQAQLAYNPGTGNVIVAGLKNLKGGFKVDELDATDHSNNGWKSMIPGLKEFQGSATLDYIEGDASQEYLLNAVFNSTPLLIILLPVDAAGSGANSFVGPAVITAWDWDGENTKLEGVDITLKGNGPFTVVAQ